MKTIYLKLFIIISLFFPAVYSSFQEDYKAEYYITFTLAYAVLLIYMGGQLFLGRQKERDKFLILYLAGIFIYNAVSLYMNVKYLHWYGEQIDNTIAFLFLLFLCWYEDSLGEQSDRLVIFFLRCAVLSNIVSIVYFFMGYMSYLICNNQFLFCRLPEDYYEFRHHWIYSHKSDYALMLTAFIAAAVRFRNFFRSRFTWCFSLAVFLAALFLTHSWTGFGAAALVFLGAWMDRIDWKKVQFRRLYLLWGAAAAAGGGIFLKLAGRERNLFSLGGRLDIWRGAIKEILNKPEGWGYWFTEVLFEVTPEWQTNNAHNVFLNALLRFSVPVGLCFTLLFLMIIGYSLYKSRTWMAAGMWLGFLILLNMDYSLLNYEIGMFLFVVYLVCIYKPGQVLFGADSRAIFESEKKNV
ncbi:MAG: hypothetical protein HFI23_01060 [Lachnospiraceae bacterium]|nr:hypothetical protein [Lachnospiraceae bacterium]